MTEHRAFFDPDKSAKGVKPGERLWSVLRFFQRPDLVELSPLERHIVEQAVGLYLMIGEIDCIALDAQLGINPPHRIYVDDEDDRKDDLRRTTNQLVENGIFSYNKERDQFLFGESE